MCGLLALAALGACGDPSGGDSQTQDLAGSTADLSDGSSDAAEASEPTAGPMRDPVEDPTPALPVEETPVDRHGMLSVVGTTLVDQHGATVQLKGPSSMWLNWENTGFASNPDTVAFFRDAWGATVIRGAMGVEPGGAYLAAPARNLAGLQEVVDTAIELGLYAIIDWHDHNAHEHQAEAIEFFQQMAMAYGETPNVIYEIYNEPLQIDWDDVVKPYHEAVVAAIRAIDPDGVIILGTPNWSQYVDVAALNPVEGTNLMYALHFYSCTHGARERQRGDRALAAGLPLFVTEWGATHADGGTPDNPDLCLDEAQVWHDWMNEAQISWAAWKLDDCVDMTCYFKGGTQAKGSYTDDELHGHAMFVRDRMQDPAPSGS